jgi:hypothetical protein
MVVVIQMVVFSCISALCGAETKTQSFDCVITFIKRMAGSFHRVSWLGREVDYSSPSLAEIKNEWSYTSSRPICFDGVGMDK